jgi:beta-lactam-binding protein with PASTA domain
LQPEVPTSGPVAAPSVLTLEVTGEAAALPDLRGLSARDVVRTLTRIGMTARLTGEGFVVEQYPPPGSPIWPGVVCEVQLGRRQLVEEVAAP